MNRKRMVFLVLLFAFVVSMVGGLYLAVMSGSYATFDEIVGVWFIVYIALAFLMPRMGKSSKPSK